MNYRPIGDMWWLARAKLSDGRKFYGAYLGGFPERARILIGCPLNNPMLHVCGGMARHYPYARGVGPNDMTLDLDPAVTPDFQQDARDPFPLLSEPWGGILIDPPYSLEDADHYSPGRSCYPKPNALVKNAMEALDIGFRVGIIHYIIPACPKNAKFIACVGVCCGFNNRIRAFSVFEKLQ